MWSRASCAPFARCAASIASSARRTARSPIACTWIWKPALSSAIASESKAAGVRLAGPRSCVPVYGSSSAEVCDSITPSAKILAPRTRSRVPSNWLRSRSIRGICDGARSRIHVDRGDDARIERAASGRAYGTRRGCRCRRSPPAALRCRASSRRSPRARARARAARPSSSAAARRRGLLHLRAASPTDCPRHRARCGHRAGFLCVA